MIFIFSGLRLQAGTLWLARCSLWRRPSSPTCFLNTWSSSSKYSIREEMVIFVLMFFIQGRNCTHCFKSMKAPLPCPTCTKVHHPFLIFVTIIVIIITPVTIIQTCPTCRKVHHNCHYCLHLQSRSSPSSPLSPSFLDSFDLK